MTLSPEKITFIVNQIQKTHYPTFPSIITRLFRDLSSEFKLSCL